MNAVPGAEPLQSPDALPQAALPAIKQNSARASALLCAHHKVSCMTHRRRTSVFEDVLLRLARVLCPRPVLQGIRVADAC
jgi:hypothetical protein